VAAVHGAAVAGGCGLATACDLVVTEPGARFAYTEVKIGFLAAMVLTFLTRRVAGHDARRMLLDPEMIDGTRAVELAAEANVRQRMDPECRRGVRTFLETKKTPDWLDGTEDAE